MEQIRSYVFGEIVKRAFPHIEIYHSDLYHVAVALGRVFADNTSIRDFRFTVIAEPGGVAFERYHGGTLEQYYLANPKARIFRFYIKGSDLSTVLCRWDLEVQSSDETTSL